MSATTFQRQAQSGLTRTCFLCSKLGQNFDLIVRICFTHSKPYCRGQLREWRSRANCQSLQISSGKLSPRLRTVAQECRPWALSGRTPRLSMKLRVQRKTKMRSSSEAGASPPFIHSHNAGGDEGSKKRGDGVATKAQTGGNQQ